MNSHLDKLFDILRYDSVSPLLFNSGLFLMLFAVFLLVYELMNKSKNGKLLFVILFSLYFYYKSSAEYCFILLGVCISDYLLGLLLGSTLQQWERRAIVLVNVAMNIGMLIYFKYLNLILDTIFGFTDKPFNAFNIILPAGISFFTFRSISYIVDIYRGTVQPCRSFLSYTFYLTFFPPLLAGPVVRAKDMLPQVDANASPTNVMVGEGFFLIICGLVKKVIVADFISQNFVERVFDNPALYSGVENLIAMYGFAIQLYCDFSGYSDMAIGIALLLGYRFFDNFRSPFKSQNPTEFWRRWHISLSFWLRDYLYIPLGGNRKGKIRRHMNLFITMLLGGLWHGASWMYLVWGGLQGLYLSGHKIISKKGKTSRTTNFWMRTLNIFVTFNLIAIAFVFFKARSMEIVMDMGRQIFTDFHVSVLPQFVESYLAIVLVIIGAYIMHFWPEGHTRWLKDHYAKSPMIIQAIILVAIVFLVIQTRQSDLMPFIYLQY